MNQLKQCYITLFLCLVGMACHAASIKFDTTTLTETKAAPLTSIELNASSLNLGVGLTDQLTTAQLTIAEMEQGGNNDETTVKIDGIYYELSDGQSFNDAIGMELLPADENVAIVVADPHYNYYGDIVIPSSINYESTTYSVVGIAEGAFAEYKEMHQRYIRSVVIPNSVLIIGEEAFVESTTLQRVEIPNSVICICDDAFGDCESLREIISYIEAPFDIPSKAFRNIASDAILYVPYGTRSLYESTPGWNRLNIIEIEPFDSTVFKAESTNGVPMTFKITDEEKKTCQIGTGISPAISISYSGKVILPKVVNGYTVTAVAANAFIYCTNIWRVYLPNTIKAIGEKAFYGCSDLSSVDSYIEEPFNIPSNVFENTASYKSMDVIYGTKEKYYAAQGWNVFNYIYAETAIIDGIRYNVSGAIPEDKGDPYTAWVEKSVWDAYEGNIVIPETLVIGNESFTVEGIDDSVFDNSDITSISIPKTMTCIESTFSGCTQLRTVISYIPNPEMVDVSSRLFEDVREDAILYVPYGTKALYEAATGWNHFKKIIEFGDGYVFTATIADGVDMTFQVISLENGTCRVGDNSHVAINKSIAGPINIPNVITMPILGERFSVIGIGNNAFADCSGLTSIAIPDGVTMVGDAAFSGCTGLIEPIYNANCFFLMSSSYEGEYTIPYGIKEIANEAFKGCSSLTGINIPNSLTTIGNSSFAHTGLTSVTLPNSVQTIGEYAFQGCSNLASITIPNSVKTIGRYAFADCIGLYSVTSLITVPYKLDESVFQCTDEIYDADIMYGIVKLFVPVGRSNIYKTTTGWMKFASIAETDTRFKLTYMVDGEVYKSYDIQAAEIITPEPDPYKEGFDFSGWSEIPYIMPAQDVTITGSFRPGVGIMDVQTNDATSKEYYTIDGRRINKMQRGLNILRMSDGTTRKVLLK